jgi:hypothetical protein
MRAISRLFEKAKGCDPTPNVLNVSGYEPDGGVSQPIHIIRNNELKSILMEVQIIRMKNKFSLYC